MPKEFKKYGCEFLKYYIEPDLHLRFQRPVQVVILEPSELDEVCHEIWLTQDKTDASCVLSTYSDNISDHSFHMLCEVLFGLEAVVEVKHIDFIERLQLSIDKIFSKVIG